MTNPGRSASSRARSAEDEVARSPWSGYPIGAPAPSSSVYVVGQWGVRPALTHGGNAGCRTRPWTRDSSSRRPEALPGQPGCTASRPLERRTPPPSPPDQRGACTQIERRAPGSVSEPASISKKRTPVGCRGQRSATASRPNLERTGVAVRC